MKGLSRNKHKLEEEENEKTAQTSVMVKRLAQHLTSLPQQVSINIWSRCSLMNNKKILIRNRLGTEHFLCSSLLMLSLGFEKKQTCASLTVPSVRTMLNTDFNKSALLLETQHRRKRHYFLTRSNSELGTHYKTLQCPAGNRKQLQMFF